MSSTICFNLDQSKIFSSGNGLKFFSDKQIYIGQKLYAPHLLMWGHEKKITSYVQTFGWFNIKIQYESQLYSIVCPIVTCKFLFEISENLKILQQN